MVALLEMVNFATKFNFVVIMTDYEYIYQQAKKAHYSGWDDAELRKCVEMLEGLSREQLFALYSSRLMKDAKILKDEIFRRLFAEQLGKREERIKNLSTEELIEEFRDKKSGNVSLIRSEMQERYKAGKDKADIVIAFMESSKSDQKWIKAQMKDEQ